MDRLQAAIADLIARSGPIGFDEYMAQALYAPGLGFYASGAGAGRRRDFLTSPEVGPLFGAVVARALDAWWDDAGRPASVDLVEAGAGEGTLARMILAAGPRCGEALTITLVEAAAVQHASHPTGVTSRVSMPSPADLHGDLLVILANELLDNLPFAVVERTEVGWAEVRVDRRGTDGGGLVTVLAPLDPGRSAWCDARAAGVEVAVGARLPVQGDAAAWLREALDLVDARGAGRVVVIDYAATSLALLARPAPDWLRTFRGHRRGGDPLERPGSQDITVDVCVDQLALVEVPALDQTQATFLRAHGIADLVVEGRQRWARTGSAGGLGAIAGRSRVHESEALLDPSGLGSFRVLEWVRPGGPG